MKKEEILEKIESLRNLAILMLSATFLATNNQISTIHALFNHFENIGRTIYSLNVEEERELSGRIY